MTITAAKKRTTLTRRMDREPQAAMVRPPQVAIIEQLEDNLCPGEHQPMVDEQLWDAVHAKLAQKAPPRRRKANDPQSALLQGMVTDPQRRPMVPPYAIKGKRRYCYYETGKDLARPEDAPATRIPWGQLEAHVIEHLTAFLVDEHALRRLTKLDEAVQLSATFVAAKQFAEDLHGRSGVDLALRALVASLAIRSDHIDVTLRPEALALDEAAPIHLRIPLAARKPYRDKAEDGCSRGGKPERASSSSSSMQSRRNVWCLAHPNSASTLCGSSKDAAELNLAACYVSRGWAQRLLKRSWLGRDQRRDAQPPACGLPADGLGRAGTASGCRRLMH